MEEENETFTVRAFATIPDTITQPDTFTVTIVDDGDSMFKYSIHMVATTSSFYSAI